MKTLGFISITNMHITVYITGIPSAACQPSCRSGFDMDHHEFNDIGSDASTVASSDLGSEDDFSATSSHGTVECMYVCMYV